MLIHTDKEITANRPDTVIKDMKENEYILNMLWALLTNKRDNQKQMQDVEAAENLSPTKCASEAE